MIRLFLGASFFCLLSIAIAPVYSYSQQIALGVFIPPPMFTHQNQSTDQARRFSSFPYVTGDTFRAACDYVVDETKIPFEPDKVNFAATIFLNAELMDYFFSELHPRIAQPYILVTHNSDKAIPGFFVKYLQDPKLLAWFGQNVGLIHPKMIPLPIGIANNYWAHGNIAVLATLQERTKQCQKKHLLYLNIATDTNSAARHHVQTFFAQKSFCYASPRRLWQDYLMDVAQSFFVASPEGNGLDCHRTWEALLMGSIPVVKTSTLDSMYKDLPVVIVKEWEEVNESFLRTTYDQLQKQSFNAEKVYAGYWIELIKSKQRQLRSVSGEQVW
jgi:hypothetical protein